MENENLDNKPNLRDYDKEPIIIENNNATINFISFFVGLIFLIILAIFAGNPKNISIGSFTGLVSVFYCFANRKVNQITIKNSFIEFRSKNLHKSIKTNKNLVIYRSSDNRFDAEKKDENYIYVIIPIFIFYCYLMIFLNGIKGLFLLLYLFLMVLSIIYIPKLIFQIISNKSFKNITIHDSILIWQFDFTNRDNDIHINITPNTIQREQIRTYFLEKKNLDIEKSEKIKNIFKI